ncbi:hypothetical protein AB0L25_31720, partial [Spirillospora sp. NPDC052242]
MTIDADPGALLDRARKYERQGRPEEAAEAFAEAAGRLAARGDRAAAAGVEARRAPRWDAHGRSGAGAPEPSRAGSASARKTIFASC